jgi:hypothetical protein
MPDRPLNRRRAGAVARVALGFALLGGVSLFFGAAWC